MNQEENTLGLLKKLFTLFSVDKIYPPKSPFSYDVRQGGKLHVRVFDYTSLRNVTVLLIVYPLVLSILTNIV